MWGDTPSRLRLLDLPFTAVEWVLPEGVEQSPMTAPSSAPSSAERGKSSDGSSDRHPTITPAADVAAAAAPSSSDAPPPPPYSDAPPVNAPSSPPLSSFLDRLPEERLAFTLSDGRAGVLLVQGRRVRQDPGVAAPTVSMGAAGEQQVQEGGGGIAGAGAGERYVGG